MLTSQDMQVAKYVVDSTNSYYSSAESDYSIYSGKYQPSNPFSAAIENEIVSHMEKCSVSIEEDMSLKERSVGEFTGTFNEETQKVILVLENVGCSCGEVSKDDLRVVLNTDLTNVIEDILGFDDYRKTVEKYRKEMTL